MSRLPPNPPEPFSPPPPPPPPPRRPVVVRQVTLQAPLHELTPPQALLLTVQCLAATGTVLLSHMAMLRDLSLAMFPCILVLLFTLHRANPLAGFVAYIQILMYQNLAISLFSSTMTGTDYKAAAATSFAAGLVLAATPVWRWLTAPQPFASPSPRLPHVMRVVAVALVVVVGYAALGFVTAGPAPAMAAFRNATSLLVAVVLGLDIGDRYGFRTVATCFLASAALGWAVALVEMLDPLYYVDLVHTADFFNLKNYRSVQPYMFSAQNVVDSLSSLAFNTGIVQDLLPGLTYRFGGPNMHPISYGYVLAVSALLLLSMSRKLLLALAPVLALVLVLLFMISVKGAVLLVLTSSALYAVWAMFRSLPLLLACGALLTSVYVGFGLSIGLQGGDFHALGFMGGIHGFLRNPLGHGLGQGGNMTVGTIDIHLWQKFQEAGATDAGMESAVGVLAYQMGIGSAALVAVVVTLLRAGPFRERNRRPQPSDLMFIALCMGMVNGVFQEEAYTPYAVGLVALFCAVLVANRHRQAVHFDAEAASWLGVLPAWRRAAVTRRQRPATAGSRRLRTALLAGGLTAGLGAALPAAAAGLADCAGSARPADAAN